jgi:uncharacterized glyoxalase superfamily protein PhnB
MESLSPNLFVHDMNKTIAFYQNIGFELTMTVPEKGEFVWAMMTSGVVTFMFQTFDSLGNELPEISRSRGGSLLFYIKIKKISKFFDRIRVNCTVLKELNKTFYGATEFSIEDCNGYVLTFAEDEI